MQAPAHHDEAKAELDSVLNSGLFAHAPSLAQFLSYVCTKCLEGRGNQVKEYSIAVEALGRPADFDQKKDSIVRVEAHRLRKRLRQFYEAEGASHPLQILIPPGQYVPQFLRREEASAVIANTAAEDSESVEVLNGAVAETNGAPAEAVRQSRVHPPAERRLAGLRPRTFVVMAVGSVLVLALLVWQFAPQFTATPRPVTQVAMADGPELPAILGTPGDEIRILAGSTASKYVDRFGNAWTGDRYFKGGAVFSTPPGFRILGTRDPAIFQSRREGVFSYDIPLKPGTYELHLYFAETLFGEGNIAGGGETYRLFDIAANGTRLTHDLDVIADAPGPNTADVKLYKDITPAEDGYLHLQFTPGPKEKPFLNAIEILPGIPGKIRPVRIVARDTSVNAKDGRLWSADRHFIGGQSVLRTDPVAGTPDPELYLGERYGNFTYSIPVAPGRYTATLRFSESWFGAKKPAGGGAGERVFDVYANGVALLRNFDIFKEAGGGDRALDKVFRGLEPNAQGKLVFSFVPVVNYACINAIEVVNDAP